MTRLSKFEDNHNLHLWLKNFWAVSLECECQMQVQQDKHFCTETREDPSEKTKDCMKRYWERTSKGRRPKLGSFSTGCKIATLLGMGPFQTWQPEVRCWPPRRPSWRRGSLRRRPSARPPSWCPSCGTFWNKATLSSFLDLEVISFFSKKRRLGFVSLQEKIIQIHE